MKLTSAIQIGAKKESIKEARAAINDILKSGSLDETKREALKCLSTLCQVTNTTITNCTFNSGGTL
jgi:hypothetical protein